MNRPILLNGMLCLHPQMKPLTYNDSDAMCPGMSHADKLLLSVIEARYIQALNIQQRQMLQTSRHTARYPCSINHRTYTNISKDRVIYPMMAIYLIAQILLSYDRHFTCKPATVLRFRRHLAHPNLGRIFVIDRLILIRQLVQLLV